MVGKEMFTEVGSRSHDEIITLFREIDVTPKDALLADKVNTEEAMHWYDICSNCYPTDEIIITSKVLNFLEQFLISAGFDKHAINIPDDLILEGKTPLPNVIFKLPDKENEHTYRFVLNGVDLYLIDTLNPKMFYKRRDLYPHAKVFSVISKFKHDGHFFQTDLEEVYVSEDRMSPHCEKLPIETRINLRNYYRSCYNFDSMMLQVWYAVQLLLLHPQIIKSDILKRDGKTKISETTALLKKKSKRKACYVKRETVNTDIFNHKEFTRKTMCWYVIGHYRKHGDGRVWVYGYWKGPLRDTKKNHDEGRERILKGVDPC